jgi:nucleoside phosphorylase
MCAQLASRRQKLADRLYRAVAGDASPPGANAPARRGRLGKTAIGVLTIIDEELSAARQALEAEHRFPKSGDYHAADGTNRFVLCRAADRSNMPAAEAVGKLIERWRPDIILVSGIAGGIPSNDPWLGDVVVPDYLHYGEFRKLTRAGGEGQDSARYFAYDHPSVSLREDIVLGLANEQGWRDQLSARIDRPEEAEDPAGTPRVWAGTLVAGEKVLGDPQHYEQRRAISFFPEAGAIDMESVGVARAVHAHRCWPDYNPRFLVVRGISDLVVAADVDLDENDPGRAAAEQDNNEQRKKWKEYAAASAAALTAAIVEELTR